MNYKESLTEAMTELAKDPAVCFVGYGVRYGGKAAGTLKGVADSQLIETPVAENLMVSMAIGLSLAGRKPVVFIERMDFILNALDAVVNHLNAMPVLSHGVFTPAMILRVVVGNSSKPLFTGPVHTRDFSEAIEKMIAFPVARITRPEFTGTFYRGAYSLMRQGRSTMLVEYKDLL